MVIQLYKCMVIVVLKWQGSLFVTYISKASKRDFKD
jgi:hypothetical protein